MSVDYYSCNCCGKGVYEEYVGKCSKCGHSLCTNCLINDDINSSYAGNYSITCDGTKQQADEIGFDLDDYAIGETIEDSGIDSKYCPFCSGKEIHNDDLLEYLLNKFNLSKDVLIQEYNKLKK